MVSKRKNFKLVLLFTLLAMIASIAMIPYELALMRDNLGITHISIITIVVQSGVVAFITSYIGLTLANKVGLASSSDNWGNESRIVVGGGPSTIYGVQNSNYYTNNFYLMKALNAWDHRAIINRVTWIEKKCLNESECKIAKFFMQRVVDSNIEFIGIAEDTLANEYKVFSGAKDY